METKFNIGDKFYKVVNSRIEEISIIGISVNEHFEVSYKCREKVESNVTTFPEKVLLFEWFSTPEKAADHIVYCFKKTNQHDI